MDHLSDLETWKRLLETLRSPGHAIDSKVIKELTTLFDHLSPQTAPRLQKDYELCSLKTIKQLKELFDNIDLSNKPLLGAFLEMLRSFGYFRIAQVTYHIERPGEEHDPDSIYLLNIEKSKWYDLCPLLPEAGTIGWKAIMNHGIVKDEKQLLQVCLQLLSQKLHFYSVLLTLDGYHDHYSIIKRNGEKTAEKLFELIKDVAYDDECLVGLNTSLYDLLTPFINEDQQAAIIEAIVRDLFKPHDLQKPVRSEEMNKIYELINVSIMTKTDLQDLLITKLLENLKCNIIRRKRRHSVETSLEDSNVSLESILDDINNGVKLVEILSNVKDIELSVKSLQSGYISYWLKILDKILIQGTLKPVNSLKILGSCCALLLAASSIISEDLIYDLSSLMAKTIIDTIPSRLDRLFNPCCPVFLIEFTKVLNEKTSALATFEDPIQKFYKSYLNRYMLRCCLGRGLKLDPKKLTQFVTFICDKSMNKNTAHLLQYICIRELAGCLERFKNEKVNDTYMSCAKLCSKRLFKFIKRNLHLSNIHSEDRQDDIEVNDLNGSTNDTAVEVKNTVVIDALVSILRIAVNQNDEEILDCYSDLLLKIYSAVNSRMRDLIEATRTGAPGTHIPLDSHLSKLLILYIEHQEMIKGYLNYDLIKTLSCLLIIDDPARSNGSSSEVQKINKKLVYNQIKSKLEILEGRANNSMDVYPTIINKQYSSVVEQSIGDIKCEKSCCQSYWRQMRTINEVSSIILNSCELDVYIKVLENTVVWLEQCDPLDHPKVLYFFLMLESLIPKNNVGSKNSAASNSFSSFLPRISCSLIRICKSIELGPSIHVFTRPGGHKSNRGIQCCTYANCIKIYTIIFLKYPPKITNSLMTEAMQICVSANLIQYAKYSVRLHRFFIQLASAIIGLLKSICIGQKEEEILRSSMPMFLSMFSNVIRCLIVASDRQKLEVIPALQMNGHSNDNNGEGDINLAEDNNNAMSKEYETQLELLALDVARTLSNLSYLKVKMIDYAPHLISTYIKDIQRASCPDFVRIQLNEGVFRIFNLVDAHQKERQKQVIEAGIQRKTFAGRASGSLFEMIHARLDQASREIFRDMHDNYNRFHRYLGKC